MGDGEVKFFRHVPSTPLSQVVESIWYGENAPPHRFERFLPTGDVDLVINVRDAELRRYEIADLESSRRFAGPIVSGPHNRPYVIDTRQQAALLGVRFRPGCARQVLGVPLDELSNEHVALADLWGPAALAVQEAAMRATPEERFASVERVLTARMAGARLPHAAVVRALHTLAAARGPSPVGAVVEASGLSARRFIELFRRDVGMPPKRFWRVMRFRRALRALTRGASANLTSLALDNDYYDQAHFIREFKEFSGITPTTYRSTAGAYDNQVPLPGVKSLQAGAHRST
jgi:AraC-like DNA-binding protein